MRTVKIDLSRARDLAQRVDALCGELDGEEYAADELDVANNSQAQKAYNKRQAEINKNLQYLSHLCRDLGVEIDAEYWRRRGF